MELFDELEEPLIEPEWNVNLVKKNRGGLAPITLNRTRMECKCNCLVML